MLSELKGKVLTHRKNNTHNGYESEFQLQILLVPEVSLNLFPFI